MVRLFGAALLSAAVLAATPAFAQDSFSGYESFYIDGNQPVSQRTRDLVDAYVIHREILDKEEAERREKLNLFINNDLYSTGVPYGRY